MSIALMTLAWKSSLAAGQKMVLLALCDNANDQGECYPSVTMLAEKCSMNARSVQRHITEMEDAGIVTREMRNGRSTVYHIDPRKFVTPDAKSPLTQSHPTPGTVSPPPPAQCHPTPGIVSPITINEPPVEPKEKRQKGAKPPAQTLPDWMPTDSWETWVEYRRAIKAPMTAKAESLCLARLEKLLAAGHDPVAVIDQSIMSGKWTGLFPIQQDSQPVVAPRRRMEDVL